MQAGGVWVILSINHRRRLTRDRGTIVALADELSRRLPLRDPDPDSSALRAALRTLRADDRELIMLTAWEGLTPAQIATVTGRAPGTIRVQLHRARTRLRCAIGAADPGWLVGPCVEEQDVM